MKYSKVLIVSMAVLLLGGVSFAQEAKVFVSSNVEDDGIVSQIGVIDLISGNSTLLFEAYPDNSFEDVIIGPGPATDDGSSPALYVYACDPSSGLIIRFDPAWAVGGPLDLGNVEVVYQAGPAGLDPQCGWFTHDGDFIFSDTNGLGAWICYGIGFEQDPVAHPLCQIAGVDVDNLAPLGDADFSGQGITQAADGDALVVTRDSMGHILRFEMDRPTGTFPADEPTPLLLVNDEDDELALLDSLGIARLSNGEIYVTGDVAEIFPDEGEQFITGGYAVNRFVAETSDTGDKQWVLECQIVLNDDDDCGTADAYFLEAVADDTIFVAGTYDDSGCPGGSVWKIPADGDYCSAQKVFGFDPGPSLYDGPMDDVISDWFPESIIGLAVPPTGTAPLDIAPGPASDGFEDYFFSFNDHVLELTTPEECTVALVEARETPKSCLEDIISSHVDLDDDGVKDSLDGVPVLYLGDKAYGQTYYIEGPPDGEACPGVGDDGTFRYAVSAYTEDLFNPRIIRCDVPVPTKALSEADICDESFTGLCEVIDLASFFPGEGVLPDDGRISGTRSSTADFSQYFVVDSGPYGYSGDGEPGCACGFRPPVHNVDDPFADGKSVFREGRSIPFKLRITDDVCDELDGCCQGNYIAPSGVLLSIAKLYDPDGTRAFQEIIFECNGGGCDAVPYFEDPKKAKTGYHMNVRTDGWAPGTYIATATVTNSDPEAPEYVVPVLVTYFEIIP